LRKLLVPAVVVALGVSACGGDDSTDEPSAGGDEVTTEPEDADGADDPETSEDPGRFEESAHEADTGADGEDVDTVELFTAIADATVAEGSYEFEATTGDATAAGAIQIGSSLDESNMRIMAHAAGVETTVLIVDGPIFMEMTEDMPLSDDGSWMTISPECDDPSAQWNLIYDARGPKVAQAMGDIVLVSDQLANLTENADMVTVTRAGTAEIDGVATTEYHINDIAGFTHSVDETITELSYSMWVGDDDLILRVATDDGTVTTEMNYLNYGMEVDVEAPPADEVIMSEWDCRSS
jgi:hypothetical protein